MRKLINDITVLEWYMIAACLGLLIAIIITACIPDVDDLYDCSRLSEADRRSYVQAISECEMNSCVERVTRALCVEIKESRYE